MAPMAGSSDERHHLRQVANNRSAAQVPALLRETTERLGRPCGMISSLGVNSDYATEVLGPACVDDLAALAFVEGTCTPNRRTQILEHLDTCESCRELVAGVVDMLQGRDTVLTAAETELTTPEMIGPYRIGPLIAQGGMGRIYRAHDTSLAREVALKVPRSGSDALARRFEREAAITAHLEHPGIVPIHGAGQTSDGTPFYVMRLIEGRTLDILIAEATTPAARLALVERVLDISRTMAYVHGKRIVHRDLKPNNVLVGSFGETLIIDWGLAKQLNDRRRSMPIAAVGNDATDTPATREALRTRAGEVMGTPSFMPPEQATGEPVDERADVYALGAILRTVLTGMLPREADVAIEGPAPVVDVCRRAMAWEAADRYRNAGELASALETALAATRPKPAPRRSPLLWLAAASALVASVGVAIVLLARGDGPEGGARAHVVTRQPPDTLYISLSPSGTRVAFGGRERFHVLDIASGKTWTRTDWTSWPFTIQFESDDVVHYVRVESTGRVRVRWDVKTDQTERVARTNGSAGDVWLGNVRDGELIMPTDDARHLEILRGQNRTKLPSDSVRQLRLFAIAPGGERIAFVDHAPSGTVIRICDLGGATFTSPHNEEVAALTWLDDKTLLYTTGGTDGSTLWRAAATPAGIAAPTRLYHSGRGGWLGSLAARPGRILASWITSSYETRVFNRTTRADAPLNKTSASAALAWLDATTFLAYNNSNGAVERHSVSTRVLPQITSLRLSSEPVNVTRAGEILIATLRGSPARTVVAVTLADGAPRWSTAGGALTFVRCAGDLQPPCVAGRQNPTGTVSLVTIDPHTGTLGADVIAEGVIVDAAVNAAGTEVAWNVELRALFARALDRSAPAREVNVVGAGNHSIAYDPTGGLLATAFPEAGRQIVRYYNGSASPVLTAGTSLISLLRPSPDGEHLLYRVRTLSGDLVEIR